ncbi:DUF5825 family protein [Streptomyces sp. NPDC088794]|jgi:hypothetical protein|uniref:DUF5825 family protein n=1 Tax=Streptomyces sp. NPDC088794 TaxID=3365902 RepID=UPI00382623AB
MRNDLLTASAPTAPTDPATGSTGEQVRDLYRQGVRYTAIEEPVSLKSPTARDLRALDFVRVATARGMLVRWHLRVGRRADPALLTQHLTHLQPPVTLEGNRSPERLDLWKVRFYVGRCVWRRGPGFVQIRDRREGVLQLFDLDEPAYIRAVGLLEEQRTAEVDPDVLTALRDENLVLRLGDLDWWAPCLIDRWPVPSMLL